MIVMLSLSSCEEEIILSSEVGTDRITITALANPDTVVYAYISSASELNYFSTILMRSDYYEYDKIDYSKEKMYMDKEITKNILTEADVNLIVNDINIYPMVYDSLSLTYNSDYVPGIGDKLRIEVETKRETEKDTIQLKSAYAFASIPTTPKLEILSRKLKYKANELYRVEDLNDSVDIGDYWGADTVMAINMKIIDPGNERNYYRLKVRSVGASRLYGGWGASKVNYVCVDKFDSEDKLFYDSDLVKGYGFLPAYFSNVFDDVLINGKEYKFTVETRMRKQSEITPYVIVELQHLSSDLYYYLKNIEEFRISDFDLYNNPIAIHSNVSGGWGVFGAMTYDTHIVPFENKLYE